MHSDNSECPVSIAWNLPLLEGCSYWSNGRSGHVALWNLLDST